MQKEKYKYIEHTADAKFQAFGKTLEEAFENAALAMFNLVCDTSKIEKKIKKEIKIQGKDKEALLYNFLEELLFLFDSKNFLTAKIKIINISKSEGYSLVAEAAGDNATLYDFFGEVKAVTYNSMFIKKEGKKFIIQVVVDM